MSELQPGSPAKSAVPHSSAGLVARRHKAVSVLLALGFAASLFGILCASLRILWLESEVAGLEKMNDLRLWRGIDRGYGYRDIDEFGRDSELPTWAAERRPLPEGSRMAVAENELVLQGSGGLYSLLAKPVVPESGMLLIWCQEYWDGIPLSVEAITFSKMRHIDVPPGKARTIEVRESILIEEGQPEWEYPAKIKLLLVPDGDNPCTSLLEADYMVQGYSETALR